MLNNSIVDQNRVIAECIFLSVRLVSAVGMISFSKNIQTIYEFHSHINSKKDDTIVKNDALQFYNSKAITIPLVIMNMCTTALCTATSCYPNNTYFITCAALSALIMGCCNYNHIKALKVGLEPYIQAVVNNDVVKDTSPKLRSWGRFLYKVVMGPGNEFSNYVNAEVNRRRRSVVNEVVVER